jgi:hypothetical protein
MTNKPIISLFLAAAFLGVASLSANIILKFQESFETEGADESPPRYTTQNRSTATTTRYFDRVLIPSAGVGASGGTYDGSYIWGGRGINFGTDPELSANEGRITWPDFDISDVANLYIVMAAAEGGPEFEPDDTLMISVRFNGGPWQTIGGFRSTGTNSTARYFAGDENTITNLDDPRLTTTFNDFRWDLSGAGATLGLRVTIKANAIAEQHYFDNIRVYGDTSLIGLAAALNASTYVEPAPGGTTPATLTLTTTQPAPAGGSVISLLLDDVARLSTTLPEQVTLPEGQTQLLVPFDILQDGRFSGTKKVVVPFAAEGYGREQIIFFIENTTPRPNLVITEICSAPPGSLPTDLIGDINGDGIRDGVQDEFVEIVNFGDSPVDISGYTISDAIGVRHVFPEGTIVRPLRSVVVFAGGNPVGIFGGATVQVATQGSLALNNTGDVVTLAASFGTVLETVQFGAEWAQAPQSSYHRGDTMDTGFVAHYLIPEANGSLFSPGTRPSGATYGTFANTITVTLPVSSALESDADITGTVTLSSPAAEGGVVVELSSDGWRIEGDVISGITFIPDEISLPITELFIPAGQTSAQFIVRPYNDGILDGDKLVRIVASAGDDVLPGLVTLTVVDVEPNNYVFAINELFGELAGTALDPNLNEVFEEALEDQYVEILNWGTDLVDISRWQLHVYPKQGVASTTLAHVFPVGTLMAPKSALVVFGGGAMMGDVPNAALVPANFGGAHVQTALLANGNRNVNGVNIPANAPEMVLELRNEHGFTITMLELTSGQTNQGTAVTLAPDATGTPSLHFGVSSTFEALSPGLTINNAPFPGNNTGYFWLNRIFPGMAIGAQGSLEANGFGLVYNTAYPFVYVADAKAFWYLPLGESATVYAYDTALGEWVATRRGVFPNVYVLRTGEWVTY